MCMINTTLLRTKLYTFLSNGKLHHHEQVEPLSSPNTLSYGVWFFFIQLFILIKHSSLVLHSPHLILYLLFPLGLCFSKTDHTPVMRELGIWNISYLSSNPELRVRTTPILFKVSGVQHIVGITYLALICMTDKASPCSLPVPAAVGYLVSEPQVWRFVAKCDHTD